MKYAGGKFIDLHRTHTVMSKPVRINLHTAVSNSSSLAGMFKDGPYSHFYVNKSGVVEQYQDTKYRAAADYNANVDTISIETWDGAGDGTWTGSNVPPWNNAQLDALAKLIAALFKAHSTIPQKLAVDNLSGYSSRGLSWHRLGVPTKTPMVGYAKKGGILYSSKTGKACPGDKRIAQIPDLFTKVMEILTPVVPPVDVPPVVTPPVVISEEITFAHCSLEAKHFGGPDDYAGIAAELFKTGADVISLTESISEGRTVLDTVLEKLTKDGWQRWTHPDEKIAILWNSDKFSYGKADHVTFKTGDPWHGALRMTLTNKKTGKVIDVIAIHVRPKTVATPTQKQQDIIKALTLITENDFILMGDFSSNPDALMTSKGLVQISLEADTYDTPGFANLDAAYTRKGYTFKVIGKKIHNPGKWSDHRWPVEVIKFTK